MLAAISAIADSLGFNDAARMKRLGKIAYCVAIIGVALLTARETIEPMEYLYKERNGNMAAVGVTGWLISTLGPIALSVGVWLLAGRFRTRWPLHLMFIPLAIIAYKGGAYVLADAYDFEFGIHMMNDFTLYTATALLLVALLTHVVALVAEAYQIVRQRTSGS